MYLILILSNIQEISFFFTIHITLRCYEGDPLSHKINYTTYTTESASDFLHRVLSI